MSNIAGELARVRGAFGQPTLTLLHQRLAPVIIAVFRSSFGRDTRSVPAARLHDQVEAYLDELRQAGHDDLPPGTGRDLCLRWMRGQWLVRSTEEDGSEIYSLTSHAQDALKQVKDLTRERASLSEHRITTIVSAVRRFNTEVNPDRAARVELLNTEIAKLAAERDQLLAGGDLPQIAPDYLSEGFDELHQLIAGLPSDFARVEEAFVTLRSAILAAFRAESRPAGEVIDDYLRRVESLMTATAEGRAFEGAFTLLRDDVLLHQLREDIQALLNHPLTEQILPDADRRDLRGTVALIRRGIDEVLTQRNRVTAALKDYIVTHDITRDRELDATLRQIDAELTTWMTTAGPRTTVPVELLPPRATVATFRERFHDTADDTAPPPLADVSDDRPEELSVQQLLQQGGPSLDSLRAALTEALSPPAALGSLGELFRALDPDLRRPVEVLGLLHLAVNRPDFARAEATELYPTIRPDGTVRDLDVPVLAPQPAPEAASGASRTAPKETR